MTFRFSTVSERNLVGVHPDLVRVMRAALLASPIDFRVVEGLRTIERQRQLIRAGASQTLNSRHLTGHAVDIAPIVGGKVRWDWPLFHRLAEVVKGSARDLSIPIEWGGDWRSFPDGPHFQLPWSLYPRGS
jgi:peptidoglycan LD-endopeptidase CwlK